MNTCLIYYLTIYIYIDVSRFLFDQVKEAVLGLVRCEHPSLHVIYVGHGRGSTRVVRNTVVNVKNGEGGLAINEDEILEASTVADWLTFTNSDTQDHTNKTITFHLYSCYSYAWEDEAQGYNNIQCRSFRRLPSLRVRSCTMDHKSIINYEIFRRQMNGQVQTRGKGMEVDQLSYGNIQFGHYRLFRDANEDKSIAELDEEYHHV